MIHTTPIHRHHCGTPSITRPTRHDAPGLAFWVFVAMSFTTTPPASALACEDDRHPLRLVVVVRIIVIEPRLGWAFAIAIVVGALEHQPHARVIDTTAELAEPRSATP